MRLRNKPYIRVIIQIFLVVSMSFAFSYLINGTSNLVSAQSNPINTCLESVDGKICQEYFADDCEEQCADSCLPMTRENVADCDLGVCYDPVEGTCSQNSPKKFCEDGGGTFDSNGNIPECELGCCLIGDETEFYTEQQCHRIEDTLGILTEFKPEIKTQSGCWALSKTQVEGACIIGSGEDKICNLITKSNCFELNGDFNEGFLCSHPDLETGCEKQVSTNCIEGKDEIYWIDSCGNRENIYEGSSSIKKTNSWNNGLIKPKSESCEVGNSFNDLANQGTCGNCDVLVTSTKCGEKTASEKLNDDSQEVVCKDISCWDLINNKKRVNEESWCYYQGNILPKEGNRDLLRGTATPGSRNFKMYCHEGQIYNVSCGDKRNKICTESQIERDDGSFFSSADCRENLAYLCLEYNTWDDKDDAIDKCKENPDCFVKRIRVSDSNFKFDACVPRYPIGFDFTNEDAMVNGEAICGLASLECKAAKVDKIGKDKWKNKGCLKEGFTRQLNDFCMSLGDCGASVNYVGEFSDSGYTIDGAPKLEEKYMPVFRFSRLGFLFDEEDITDMSYINSLSDYHENVEGEYIESANIDDLLSSMGQSGEGEIGEGTGEVDSNFPEGFENGIEASELLGYGAGGWALFHWANTAGTSAASSLTAPAVITPTATGPAVTTATPGAWGGFLGAVAGAVIGGAITSFLIQASGIGAGISPALAWTLITAGAIGGGMIGYAAITGWSSASTVGVAGIWTLAITLVIIGILRLFGVGDVTEYTATFECKPWQPPIGGDDCSKCGEDGLGCSKYACESLGAACEFINEGTSFEKCDSIPDDGIPPQINPLYEVLTEEFEYDDVSDNGFKVIAKNTDDGCIPAFTLAMMGIKLHEPGRCTFAIDRGVYDEDDILDWLDEADYNPEDFGLSNEFLGGITEGGDDSLQDYDEDEGFTINQGMDEFYLGGHNIFLYNHTHPLFMPSLGSLGVGGYDPERRIDFDLRIRCEDRHGNKNTKDYVIGACIRPEKDIIYPHVMDKDPIDELVKNDATNTNFSVYINEPSECKWSLQNKEYDLMENEMDCENDAYDIIPRAGGTFKCSSNTEMPSENLSVYIRCKDQPWLSPENESERNVMDKSYKLNLTKTSPLEITSISPNDEQELRFGTEPAEVEVEVETIGGGYNGEAECFYLYDGDYIPFKYTYYSTHSQIFDQLTSGEKTMAIRCEDTIGNTASGTSIFTIKIDDDAPQVIRAFKKGTKLKIITDEKAACYYDYNRCNFDIEDADSMSIGLSKEHTVEWNSDAVYYIKCLDAWKNWESGCSIVIKPSEF